MKYCSSCGAGLQDDMVFCPHCGQKFRSCTNEPDEDKSSVRVTAASPKSSLKKVLLGVGIVLIVLSIVFGTMAFLDKDFSDNPKAISEATQSVVKIECYDYKGELFSTGSGFCAFDERTFVTNYHVIDRAKEIQISTEQDYVFAIEGIIAADKERDIAILQTKEATGLKVLSLGDANKTLKGETVTAIGSPLGIKNTVSTGVLSGRFYDENNNENLQFTAAISSGSSGGALFNEKGDVIGITYASYTEGQNLNLAVPSNLITTIKDDGTYMRVEEYLSYAHPYIEELYKCKEVSYEDLLSEPDLYIHDMVATVGFVVETWSDHFLMVPDEQWVSVFENLDFDDYKSLYDSFDTEVTGIIHSYAIHIDDKVKPGDYVLVAGDFRYNEHVYVPEGHNETINTYSGSEGIMSRLDELLARGSTATNNTHSHLYGGNYNLPEEFYTYHTSDIRAHYFEVLDSAN